MSKQADADFILKLYDLRREPVMREARNWFFTFNPTSVQDFVDVLMGEHSGHYRMVISYWDMAASMVNQGAIDEELFNASGGEIVFVYAADSENGKSLQLRANLLQLFQSNGWSIFLF